VKIVVPFINEEILDLIQDIVTSIVAILIL
jgi:hypothetical protein